MMLKRALVFQHMDDEPAGLYGEFLAEREVRVDTVMLHKGQAIPSLAPYDLMLVMGGAMDVWEEDANPWLRAEKQAIREWAFDYHRPYFGVCLGMQLLAEAMGGTVGLAKEAEVGIGKISLTQEHGFTAALPRTFRMMQWHHAEVKVLPDGADVLAASDISPVQIMAAGDCLLGTQFHGELTPALVARWAHIPAYVTWLEDALGHGAYELVRDQALPMMPRMASVSRNLFDNLLMGKALRKAA